MLTPCSGARGCSPGAGLAPHRSWFSNHIINLLLPPSLNGRYGTGGESEAIWLKAVLNLRQGKPQTRLAFAEQSENHRKWPSFLWQRRDEQERCYLFISGWRRFSLQPRSRLVLSSCLSNSLSKTERYHLFLFSSPPVVCKCFTDMALRHWQCASFETVLSYQQHAQLQKKKYYKEQYNKVSKDRKTKIDSWIDPLMDSY